MTDTQTPADPKADLAAPSLQEAQEKLDAAADTLFSLYLGALEELAK